MEAHDILILFGGMGLGIICTPLTVAIAMWIDEWWLMRKDNDHA